jgi:hypothetical protein
MIWSGFIFAASFSFRFEFSLRDLVTMSGCFDSFLLRGATFSRPEAHYSLHSHQLPHSYQVVGRTWVDLSRLQRTSAEVVEDERYSVDVLMLECSPNRDINEFYPSEEESPNQYVERVLQEYAQVLKECGRDVLRGDFRLFPKLKKHAEDVLRQKNKELFGSETGIV